MGKAIFEDGFGIFERLTQVLVNDAFVLRKVETIFNYLSRKFCLWEV